MARPTSAGILLYRRGTADAPLEVLLAHPGGPYFASKDAGHWSIPKGEADGDEPLIDVARREFAEETGHRVPGGEPIELGSIVQKGGKTVHAWAFEGDLDPAEAHSNLFETEWPPRSGRRESFPEIDRVAWFTPDVARQVIKPTQIPLLDRLEAALAERARSGATPASIDR
jgi:predicted NUDIX family NTP pyrophosphohydrolase